MELIEEVEMRPEVEMGITRSKQSLDLLKQATSQDGDAELVLTSFKLRKSQKDMIEGFARQTGESQATIVRTIIDEWREMKLSEVE